MKALVTKDIGNIGERAAAKHLKRLGYRIVAKNRHYGKNELDLIVRDRECIAFVEVKALTFADPAEIDKHPAMKVNMEKRRRTVEAAMAYLSENPSRLCTRFDVVEVFLDRSTMKPFRIHHIPDAFSAKGEIR